MMAAGMFLSQPAMQTRPSKLLPRDDEFDGIGDDLARDERGLHALGAHGDAVGDGDGVELHGGSAGFADALLDGGGDLSRRWKLQGPTSVQVLAMPMMGLCEIFLGEADATRR